jgi:hypothetical protein
MIVERVLEHLKVEERNIQMFKEKQRKKTEKHDEKQMAYIIGIEFMFYMFIIKPVRSKREYFKCNRKIALRINVNK